MKAVSPANELVPGQVSGLRRLARLARKELRETLRDRRTIITLVVMPVLVYPLLSIIFHQFLLSGTGATGQSDEPDIILVGVGSPKDDEELSNYLQKAMQVIQHEPRPIGDLLPVDASVETLLDERKQPQNLVIEPRSDYMSRLQSKEIDVAVELRRPADNQGPTTIVLHFRPESPRSRQGADLIQRRLHALNRAFQAAKLQSARLSPLPLVGVNLRPHGSEMAGTAFSLSALIPVVLVLMTVTGAVYPAIDLTAGERERNTLECLIAAPISRMQLLLAKYVAVLTVALLTAGVNLLGMIITLRTTGVGQKLLGPGAFTLSNLAAVLALLVLFAAFYSAVLLAITSLARSFKEAQAYLIPLMLLSLGPALASLMPGLKLTPLTSVMPLINVVLLARDLLGQEVESTDLIYGGVAVVSTLLYSAVALTLAARIFGSDSILYGSDQTWGDLWRRPPKTSQQPTPTMLAVCFALLFPLYVFAGGALGQTRELDLTARLLLNAGITAALFAWLPTHLVALRNVRWKNAFWWHAASPWALLGGAILGLSLWPIAHELVLLSHRIGLANLTEARLAEARQLVDKFRDLSPALVLFCLAIVPAVCEELFFRGFLLSSLRRHVDAAAAIAISAVSFGLFHVLAGHLLTPERLLSSTFLGLFLATVAWRTQSVLPGIVLHAVNNGLLLSVAVFNTGLEESYGIGALETRHLPASWLAGSVLGAAVGLGCVWLAKRPGEPVPATDPPLAPHS